MAKEYLIAHNFLPPKISINQYISQVRSVFIKMKYLIVHNDDINTESEYIILNLSSILL
jgi:hypothetical protein